MFPETVNFQFFAGYVVGLKLGKEYCREVLEGIGLRMFVN